MDLYIYYKCSLPQTIHTYQNYARRRLAPTPRRPARVGAGTATFIFTPCRMSIFLNNTLKSEQQYIPKTFPV